MSGGAITLLSVIEAAQSPFRPSPSPGEEDRAPWLAYLQERAAEVRAAGVAGVTLAVRSGNPASVITDAARDAHAEVIVMSTEGLGSGGRYALGSVALRVLMTAPCPVFMVRIIRPDPPQSTDEERWQSEGGRNVA